MAFSDGKLYVVDLGRKLVEILDFNDRTFDYLTWDRRLKNPVDIWVDGENKYVTDSKYGAVFVFDKSNTLSAILGKKLNIRPLGVVVRGDQCYITDAISQQVVVLDKYSGEEISRMGKQMTDPEQLEGSQAGQFRLISDLALDQEGNVYVTDRVIAQIMKFDSSGRFVRFFGRIGDRKGNFVRPKGIAIDREDRIWVVDAATQVCKVYDPEGLLLLYFGMAGNSPGMMNLPATVILDYDNVELFKEYAVDGAELEFLVVITNHYGPHKVAVYGFGTFPVQETGSVPDTLERPGASEVVDEIQEPNKEQPEK